MSEVLLSPVPEVDLLASRIEKAASSRQDRKVCWTLEEFMCTEFPNPGFLVERLLPLGSVGLMCGAPDSGKSMFARHLLLAVCKGNDSFLGLKLNAPTRKAIYVVTEDSNAETKQILTKQLRAMGGGPEDARNLVIITADELDLRGVLDNLENLLQKNPVDLIAIDALGDIFAGRDGNDNLSVREGLKPFHSLANRYGCHILFVTHVNKSTYAHSPDQAHVQGASAFAQKARLILDLRSDENYSGGEFDTKILSVTKGNYLSRASKEQSLVLHFDPKTFLYQNTGEIRRRREIGGKPKEKKRGTEIEWPNIFDGAKALGIPELIERVVALTGLSDRQARRRIEEELKLDGAVYLNPGDDIP